MTRMHYARPKQQLANKRFSDIMDEFFNDGVQSNSNSFVPSINISETEAQFLITAELPGMKKEDIQIDLENGQLTLSGERTITKDDSGETFHRVESRYGSFNRSFQLPDYVDQDSVNATYENGLLSITIQKAENKVKRQIEIN